MCISKRIMWIISKSHQHFFFIFLQSTHQVDMKHVVKCSKHFFGYFNTLETQGESPRMKSFCNNLFLVSINLWLWVLYSVSSIVIICMRRKKTPIYSSHDNGRNQVEFPKNAPAWKSGISCSLHLLYISNSDLYFEIPFRKWPDSGIQNKTHPDIKLLKSIHRGWCIKFATGLNIINLHFRL